MNRMDTATLEFERGSLGTDLSDLSSESAKPFRAALRNYAGAAAIFLVSSFPGAQQVPPPPWVPDRRRDSATVLINFGTIYRRRMSIREARRLALKVLYDAEKRREDFAESEARHFAWYDGV